MEVLMSYSFFKLHFCMEVLKVCFSDLVLSQGPGQVVVVLFHQRHPLTQVSDDIEDERVNHEMTLKMKGWRMDRIVLNSTFPCGQIIEDINQVWEKEFSEGKKLNWEGVEILGFDFVDLYRSMKLEYMIREIDRAMSLRIETKEGEEKGKDIVLRNDSLSLT